VTYYFVVRAEDNAGNEEANTVTKSAELAVLEKPFDFLDYWWIFLIIIIILLLVVIALLARRRKGEEPVETPTEVEEGIEEESTEELGDEG
jgi:flagellar biosynthesis/type III secretory pathway M-ring protein FliF/YscJ